ncbi:hypothetical protein [Pseudonocardia adelaidensis]|uniref:DUF1440 domain-containing protein n=1 Tax=Pseudonocardia adelaidensis TaxID=648754 RepID=A0ABP9P748_9PSEU
MSKRRGSGIGSRAIRGMIAGAVGTAAMDLVWFSRYRRGGGKDPLLRWEFGGDVLSWADASAPGQFGQNVERIVTGRQPPEGWARTTTNVVHWATGIGWAVQYSVLAGRPARHPVIRAVALGPVVWLSGYVTLALTGVYEPIWKYDVRTLADDLSAHFVFGLTTSATYAALTRQRT